MNFSFNTKPERSKTVDYACFMFAFNGALTSMGEMMEIADHC